MHNEKLEMDSSEFEKKFNVYTSNQITAMQLLTPDIMEELLSFAQNAEEDFDIYIENNNLYLRFHCGTLFEPGSLKKGAIDEKTLKRYYDILEFTNHLSKRIIQIIHETEI